jgi:hypothetical protein
MSVVNTVQDDRQLLIEHRSVENPTVYYIQRLSNFREQTSLAVRLVTAAFRQKVFKKENTLLIIGGGVSGAAAGLEASQRGMIVTLFESKRTLLSVQQRCKTRYLHPYEYYWPLAHYQKRTFPFTDIDKKYSPRPMRWSAGVASDIAKKLADQILKEKSPNLSFRLGVKHIPVSQKTLLEDFDSDGDYQFILVCAGARERTGFPNLAFASFPYWENDPLEKLCSRYADGSRRKEQILLSGGGDGGLQDLLRIVTKPTRRKPFAAGQILEKLLPTLRRNREFNRWLKSKQFDGNCYRPFDVKPMLKDFEDLLNSMEADFDYWRSLSRMLLSWIHPAILKGDVRIRLAFKEKHFSRSFALNVFLVRLLERIIKNQQLLLPGHEIHLVNTATKTHQCKGDPKDCFTSPHFVSWKISGARSPKKEAYDVVVLRHGSDQQFTNAQRKREKP